MTDCLHRKEKNPQNKGLATLLCIILTTLLLLFSADVKVGIIEGLRLIAFNIIPTLFPFFVLSDLWLVILNIKEESKFSILFQRIFHINSVGLLALLIGSICGFPLGVKSAVDYYERDLISKNELERLCGFINNPSIAFVVSGVGLGVYGSLFVGFTLYIIVLFSALLVGFIFKPNKYYMRKIKHVSGQSFNLVSSIVNAGSSTIKICSFIILFCAVIGLFSGIIHNEFLISFFSALCEIGSATSIIGGCNSLSLTKKEALTAFALGFSGFCVHMQAFSLLPPGISRKKYLLMKLLQGIFSSIIAFFIFSIINK